MATNTKPQLIVLIDEAKREQLKALAQASNKSMGWIVNQLIDRLLSGETVLEMPVETAKPLETIDIAPIENRLADIEERLADIKVIEDRLVDIERRLADIEVIENRPVDIEKPDKPETIDPNPSQTDKGYMDWVEFHEYIGDPHVPGIRPNKKDGDRVVAIAKTKGFGDWIYKSGTKKFFRA